MSAIDVRMICLEIRAQTAKPEKIWNSNPFIKMVWSLNFCVNSNGKQISIKTVTNDADEILMSYYEVCKTAEHEVTCKEIKTHLCVAW